MKVLVLSRRGSRHSRPKRPPALAMGCRASSNRFSRSCRSPCWPRWSPAQNELWIELQGGAEFGDGYVGAILLQRLVALSEVSLRSGLPGQQQRRQHCTIQPCHPPKIAFTSPVQIFTRATTTTYAILPPSLPPSGRNLVLMGDANTASDAARALRNYKTNPRRDSRPYEILGSRRSQ